MLEPSYTKSTLASKSILLQAAHPRAAVLLFHGITGAQEEVLDLGISLAELGYHVVIPLLSGHDGTIELLAKTPAEAWLADVRRALVEVRELGPLPIVVGGLSFGGVLALAAAAQLGGGVRAAFVLSIPLRLRSSIDDLALRLLSYLPDSVLNTLPVVPKKPRATDAFVKPRSSLEMHSVGAMARVYYIRRRTLQQLWRLSCPLLVLQDCYDHHVPPNSIDILFRYAAHVQIKQRWYPGGQHELTLGKWYQEVERAVGEFVDTNIGGAARDGADSKEER